MVGAPQNWKKIIKVVRHRLEGIVSHALGPKAPLTYCRKSSDCFNDRLYAHTPIRPQEVLRLQGLNPFGTGVAWRSQRRTAMPPLPTRLPSSSVDEMADLPSRRHQVPLTFGFAITDYKCNLGSLVVSQFDLHSKHIRSPATGFCMARRRTSS